MIYIIRKRRKAMTEKNEKEAVKIELTDEQLEAVNGGFTFDIYCPFCVEPVSVDIEDLRKGTILCNHCGFRILF